MVRVDSPSVSVGTNFEERVPIRRRERVGVLAFSCVVVNEVRRAVFCGEMLLCAVVSGEVVDASVCVGFLQRAARDGAGQVNLFAFRVEVAMASHDEITNIDGQVRGPGAQPTSARVVEYPRALDEDRLMERRRK